MDTDLTDMSIEEIVDTIKEQKFPNETSAISSFEKFMALDVGDIVAVNNTNDGLFGVGRVTSDYKYRLHIHDSGDEDKTRHYSHYKEVEWLTNEYLPRKKVLEFEEKSWQPFGTTGVLEPALPDYIKRILGIERSPDKGSAATTPEPDFLKQLVSYIEELRKDSAHQERAHESLVEDFLILLGYQKHADIKYRQSRIDLTIWSDNRPLLLLEVKRDWNLNWETHSGALRQAYGYSYDQGIRYIMLTNGDYYAIFDRIRGLSYNKNIIGEFQLTSLQSDDIRIIDRLRKENLSRIDVSEILRNVSVMFEQ